MKFVRGFALPDFEQHLIPFLEQGPEFAGGPTYQLHKYLACMPLIKNFRRAVDVGAHCGLWSRVMARCFTMVSAFEPVLEHRICFDENLRGAANITLHACALGEREGLVTLHTGQASSGDTYVQKDGEHGANLRTLDSFDLLPIDFLKIDCEGYEKFVLMGGEKTIRRDKPCIIVEQKPGKAKQFGLGDIEAVQLLQAWGAELVTVVSGDYIMRWRG